jgi:hypothetical protein
MTDRYLASATTFSSLGKSVVVKYSPQVEFHPRLLLGFEEMTQRIALLLITENFGYFANFVVNREFRIENVSTREFETRIHFSSDDLPIRWAMI